MAAQEIEHFIGPCIILMLFAFILYGVSCAQVYFYWTTYHDHLAIRLLVITVATLEAVHTGLCMHIVYEYLVSGWGDHVVVGRIIWSVIATVFVELVVSSFVQGYYIYRIWRFRRQIIPVAVMIIIMLAHIGVSFMTTAYTSKYNTYAGVNMDNHFKIGLNWTFGLNVALDACITTVLTIYLLRDRSVAAKQSTRKIVTTLLQFTFSAGILTVVASCAFFIAYNVTKATLTFLGVVQVLAKLYANSMFAMLNARNSIARAAANDTKYTVELDSLRSTRLPPAPPTTIQIHTQTITTSTKDSGSCIEGDLGRERTNRSFEAHKAPSLSLGFGEA